MNTNFDNNILNHLQNIANKIGSVPRQTLPNCLECNSCLFTADQLKMIYKNRLPANDCGTCKPRLISGTPFFRVRCFDCLDKHTGKIHKRRIGSSPSGDWEFLFNIPNDILTKYMRSRLGVSKSQMIDRYGATDGLLRWQKYCERQAETNTFEYKHAKYGWTREQFDNYNASRSTTKANLIRRWGEEKGIAKWNAYVDRQKYAGKTLQFFIDTYGAKEGLVRYNAICKKKGMTRENFINRYGAIVGMNKFQEYSINQHNKMHKTGSKKCDTFILALKDALSNYTIITEFPVYCPSTDKMYFLDAYIKELNTSIEFFGTYWHADPRKYTAEDLIQISSDKTMAPAKDIWLRDSIRKNALIADHNILQFVVWEKDFDASLPEVLLKCKAWIKECK